MDLSLPDSFHAVENKIKSSEEFTLTLKRHRNTLLPISRLPTEIFIIIFSLLHACGVLEPPKPLAPFSISHVCHRWREISLNLPHLWVHINFTRQRPDCVAELLTRSKTAPLHLEAVTLNWSRERFEAFKRQIEAHIHHTRHLCITASAKHLVQTFGRLVSSAPFLEQFSIINGDPQLVIPQNLFDGIAPKLIYLRLDKCAVRWKKQDSPLLSPLLKGLRDLKLVSYPAFARIKPKIWLDALSQMTQLERLSLSNGTPIHSATPLPVEPGLTVVLSSLTQLDVSGSLRDCMAVLAHLVLPALTRLCVNVTTMLETGHIPLLISRVSRNAHGPQDTEVLQSLFIGSNNPQAGIAAWTMPRQDTDAVLSGPHRLPVGIHFPRVEFSIIREFLDEYDMLVYDELLTALPLDSITSLTVKGCALLTSEVWRGLASRWRKLQRVQLFRSAVPPFREMLADEPIGDPLLPSLEELVIIDVFFDAQQVLYLYNLLTDLLVHQISLKTLDLRMCNVTSGAVRTLSRVVPNVQGPVKKVSDGKTREGMEVLGEEVERDELNIFGDPNLRPYWVALDDCDFSDEHEEDEDEEDEDERWSTGSEMDYW